MSNHTTLNPRRFITTPSQADEVKKAQRELHKMQDNLNIALAEVSPIQRKQVVDSIDVGIFNVVDQKAFVEWAG